MRTKENMAGDFQMSVAYEKKCGGGRLGGEVSGCVHMRREREGGGEV